MTTQLDRIHALVLPGYGLYTDNAVSHTHEIYFMRYAQKVGQIALQEREALIAILARPLESESVCGAFVSERIRVLQEQLASRMVTMEGFSLCFGVQMQQFVTDLQQARGELHSRGYAIGNETRAEVFGETFRKSVPVAAAIINDEFELSHPTVIRAHYTNVGVRIGETPTEQRQRFLEIQEQPDDQRVTIDWDVPQD